MDLGKYLHSKTESLGAFEKIEYLKLGKDTNKKTPEHHELYLVYVLFRASISSFFFFSDDDSVISFQHTHTHVSFSIIIPFVSFRNNIIPTQTLNRARTQVRTTRNFESQE